MNDILKQLLEDLPEEAANTLHTLLGSVAPATALPVTPELDRMHLRAAEVQDADESEKYLRDLLGHEEYEAWDND